MSTNLLSRKKLSVYGSTQTLIKGIVSIKLVLKMSEVRLQNARVERLIRSTGAFRVSAGAIEALNTILSEYALNVAKYAVSIAEHSGRKTVKDSDIVLASKR